MSGRELNVGLAVGRGTGPELAAVFIRAIHQLAARHSIQVNIHRSSRLYHSYFSLQEYFSNNPEKVKYESNQDVQHYLEFCSQALESGCSAIFRTAINAQSLYTIREHLQGVKLEHFRHGPNEMLLVRDQAQGFYAGANEHDVAAGIVTRGCVFDKKVMERLVRFSIDRAQRMWGSVDKILLVYKFHLFDGVLSAWAQHWAQQFGIKVDIVQPDTANRNILANGLKGRQLVLAGNEWGDIMHVMLLNMFDNMAQEERCTENIYLHESVSRLCEYQTVHGSADDIAGKNLVNPSATLRAAADILERKGGCIGAMADMERALKMMEDSGVGTGDQKRKVRIGTQEMVDRVMAAIGDEEKQPLRAKL